MSTGIIIGIIAGIAVIVLLAVSSRIPMLEDLPLLSGEEIIFDDPGASFKIYQRAGRSTYYTLGFVRITNRRIITSQGMLLYRGKHAVRCIVGYSSEQSSGEQSRGEPLTQGHFSFSTSRDNITVDKENGNTIITITPGESGLALLEVQRLIIYPQKPEEYRRVFQ